MFFKLVGKEVVAVDDPLEWAEAYESADRIVAQDRVAGSIVSTVFLGIKIGPVGYLFETRVFDGVRDGYAARYSTWDQAEAGHKGIVAMLKTEALN